MLVRNFFQGYHYLTFLPMMGWQVNPADLGGGSGNGGTEESSGQGPETSGYSELAQSILKDVPDEHKSILEPYMKRWDAGTTRRFQDLSNKYKHYDSLGWDEDTTQQMSAVYQALMEDPQSLYDAIGNELGLTAQEQKQVELAGETQQGFQGLPPEMQTQWDQTQQVLQALAQYVLDDQRSKQESVEDREFDEYLGLLKQEYGEFDEKFVISRIANGMDGEAAVNEWNELINGHLEKLSESTQHLPNSVLSSAGGGAVSQGEPQKLADIPGKDIRQLIANVLSQTNAAGQ